MWPNAQDTAEENLLRKSLMENFIFCAVQYKWLREHMF